jgi:hypothetical protein
MESKPQYCTYRSDHSNRFAVVLMRSTCPYHPERCSYYKIKALCQACKEHVEAKIAANTSMHCSYCHHEGRVRDYWAILGSV